MADAKSIPSVWDGRCPRHGDEMQPIYAGRSSARSSNQVSTYRCPVCIGLYRAKVIRAIGHNRYWPEHAA